MATSGVGRGRGWLNLNKTNISRPGKPVSPRTENPVGDYSSPATSPAACLQQYAKIVTHINELDGDDDGILMNQKFKNVMETWSKVCTTSTEVEESFNYIYQRAMKDEDFATKLVSMVASYKFMTIEICEQKVRTLFIGKIQNTFENAKQLQNTNPISFRNGIRILSQYYNKARLISGKPITILATPLVCYFEMLLESAQPADIELFTTQLFLNGSAIKTHCPEKLNELLSKVRQLLVYNSEQTQICKLYLLLAIEIANHRFTLLPSDVYKFYQEKLGDKIMTHFQGTLGTLRIETLQTSKTLDSYQSNVNVLQVTPPDSTSPVESQPPLPTKTQPQQNTSNIQNKYNSSHSTNSSQSFETESAISTNSWDNNNEKANLNNREKAGRPILGAGARFQKIKSADSDWRNNDKQNTGWSSKQKNSSGSGWNGEKKPHAKTSNKGWEHDDRFDNEYN